MDEAKFEILHAGWRPAYSWWLKRALVRGGLRRVMKYQLSIHFPRKENLLHALFTGLAAAEGAERWISRPCSIEGADGADEHVARVDQRRDRGRVGDVGGARLEAAELGGQRLDIGRDRAPPAPA